MRRVLPACWPKPGVLRDEDFELRPTRRRFPEQSGRQANSGRQGGLGALARIRRNGQGEAARTPGSLEGCRWNAKASAWAFLDEGASTRVDRASRSRLHQRRHRPW